MILVNRSIESERMVLHWAQERIQSYSLYAISSVLVHKREVEPLPERSLIQARSQWSDDGFSYVHTGSCPQYSLYVAGRSRLSTGDDVHIHYNQLEILPTPVG